MYLKYIYYNMEWLNTIQEKSYAKRMMFSPDLNDHHEMLTYFKSNWKLKNMFLLSIAFALA